MEQYQMLAALAPALVGAAGSLIGGFFDRKNSQETADKNIALQKEFAQQGIGWKVKDAKRSGIHPLYALGAQTHSFSPVQVGETNFANIGQDLGRAAGAALSADTKADVTTKAAALSLENQGLQNEMLRAQIRQLNNKAQVPPPPQAIGDPKHKLTDPELMTGLKFGGASIQIDPNFSNMQSFEDRYGEDNPISKYVIGPSIVGADLYNTYSRWRDSPGRPYRYLHERLRDRAR